MIPIKNGDQMWVAGQPQAATLAGKPTHGRVVRRGQRPHARAHLQALRALLARTAAGASRLRSATIRGEVHHDAAVHALLLERPKVTKMRLPALQHAAHAHEQHLDAVQAVRCAPKQARPHSGTRHTIAITDSEDEDYAETSDGTFVGEGRPQK